MPLPSSGIIVVEKPSSSSVKRINNSTLSIKANNSIHPPQSRTEQQTQIQFIEYYDVHENQLSQRQQQQQQQSTIVVDANLFHQQQQFQLGGSSGVAIGKRVHTSSASSSSLTSSSSLNKSNLQIHTLKAVPMPQTKQFSQQQQIIQHTSHSTTSTATISNPQHNLHQQSQHVQQLNLAASSIHQTTQHHHSQQQPTQTAHMIQVSEEFLEQATNNHNAGSMMISTTGEVINQQQIFKIVSADGTTGNMIIDATNQNANSTTTSKVLLSNLTVLSKQQTSAQSQIIGGGHQQPQTIGQTINFVNAKNLYTASTAGGNIASGSKQQKFAVSTANIGNYKTSTIKQTSPLNSQYIQQPNAIGQQKLNMTAGNRNMQMLTTTRVQNTPNNNTTSNISSNSNIAVISNNAVPQTMVLQQPQKFISNNAAGSKMPTATLNAGAGNAIKKSTAPGTLRMNNSHTTTSAAKLTNNLQTAQGVKTFITQSPNVQLQTQQNVNQLTLQHPPTKSGSKSKFVKQYNNAILNSAGAVAIATLPQQQTTNQSNLQIQQQQQHQLQPQTTYINHHKSNSGSTKINKINSKYSQSVNMASQLPPGTQLHQKSIIQSHPQQQQQQQFQTTNNNSNIKFVNAQGTIIQQQQQQQYQQPQQQSLTTQKINKNHHLHLHHQQYQNLQTFDTVDGNNVFHVNTNQTTSGASSTASSGTTTLPLVTTTTTATGSTLLSDDIMMVNGTQMTDELSARILQSMSQKSFSNQRYHQQQQQNVFQTKPSTPVSTIVNSNNSCNSNGNMLPPPTCATQNPTVQTNNSNILLSPREYSLYSMATPTTNQQAQQQQHSSPIQYNNSATSSATASSNITGGSFSSNNYITVSNNNNNMASIAAHSSGNSAANGILCANTTSSGSSNTARQAQSVPNSRSQSMERKLHESSMSRKSSEYYKVNNHSSLRGGSLHNNIATATSAVTQTNGSLGMTTASVSALMGGTVAASSLASSLPASRSSTLPASALIMEPQAQVIHLQATKTLPGANSSSNDDDDDIIGEEIRPAAVETEDKRLRILHAVLLDHTYVNPMPLELPTSFAVQLASTSKCSAVASTPTSVNSSTMSQTQQWSLGGIGAITATSSGGLTQQSYTIYGSQLTRLHQDIDSYSSLNNNSTLAVGEIDPGEETETAPEAELEDDSVTRCICDLTHDDGYMICCDKCCAWQHVDCMGIDRQNIPDEYLCELCQPRIVDKARARSLQLLKRKEQQQQLMLTTQAQASSSSGTIGAAGSANSGNVGSLANLSSNDMLGVQQRLAATSGGGFSLSGNISTDSTALKLLAAGGSNLKKNKMLKKAKDGVAGKRTKKAEKLAAAAAGLTVNNKPGRKETKKNTKRKKAGAHDGASSPVGMTAAEKHAANLRQWIENYELAVTNHYSPELRARLHAISKQPSLLQTILNTENPILKEFSNGGLENRATTVPHAGGKILISNLDIVPNSPICELRGKYMLTTQYKTQNTSMNMNSPPPNNYHLASYKAHKTPGPFIFFYQLPGTEVCTSSQVVPQTTTTTTLNPDGTYTTTTTTLPAQQSPPTFLRGPEICVDTRTYGNEARFVRRSCRPNAEIQHLFEKGTIHLFIVALTDIRASTEITVRHEPHDLLAIENKKSSSMIIQSTSTLCACGLTKDCIFGPPMPQLPPTTKSNAGRKSMAHGGGVSGSSGNLNAKQRKANQQNLNRNRSISSSASGDSNMGVTAANSTTIAMSLNSPNNINKMPPINKTSNSNTLMPLTASCNSNLSNSSSSSSTLTTIMHDSGVCTSSSSPSVSIPSPTQHMHSPIQQHQLINQQPVTQQLLHTNQQRPLVQLLPHQQQKQIMQSLPTPLVLPSPNISYQQQQQQQKQHTLQQQILQQPAMILQQQFNVVAQSATAVNSSQTGNTETGGKHSQTPICVLQQPVPDRTPQAQSQLPSLQQLNQKITLQEQQQQPIQVQGTQLLPSTLTISPGLLETVSAEATIAAVALQSLNTSHSPHTSLPPTSPLRSNVETQLQSPQTQQQQFKLGPSVEGIPEQLPIHQHNQTADKKITNTSSTALNNAPHTQLQQPSQLQQSQTPQQSPQQLYKSPQKNNHSQNNSTQPVRKTPAKHGRASSFSEDIEQQQQHSEENFLASTPTSSTPKEKPKLSREDRKMEAILRAIEKMERNQQKQKQTKRQNSGSLNTTPTSPNKAIETGENSGGTKRSNNHTGNVGRSKKKRKSSTKSGQSSGFNNQRKRRQIRLHSQESIEECNQQDIDAITSESDGCNVISSPPIQTNASPMRPHISSSGVSHTAGSITASLSTETTHNNVDQAAGLLMAFANPNTSPTKNNQTVEIIEQHMQQSPLPTSTQYTLPSIEVAASSPSTPPSQVSSACLLIEAAVGPLESNLDGNNSEMHSSEFKYPLQAKTKKHLMNSWLHQSEDNGPETNDSTSPDQTSQSMQRNTTSEVQSDVVGVSGVSGGLDSLLQAAMRDMTQSQSDQEQPQNLSIAAQKVEEFIQQTEASVCNVQPKPQSQNKHSFEYEAHQQRQRTYAALPTPAVDLTLKTPLTIGPNVAASETCYNRNLNLPLQVSTCSNNSSVKKRWLRQAISEETHEEFQPAFSMSPSPTTAIVENTFLHSQQQQPTSICPPVAVSNFVPNGFTTPLKKRRLLITDKDDGDDNASLNCGDICVKASLSPPPAVQQPQHMPEVPIQQDTEKGEAQDLSTRDMHEDADVDVVKFELTRTQITETEVTLHKPELQQNMQYSRIEKDPDFEQEQDVDVTTSATESAPLLQDQMQMVLKQETETVAAKVKHKSSEQLQPADFNDQEDDVDILRSPSPGREMIKAEDNLVKIEPEDTSGMEDVKIDVEREESMAADDVVVNQPAECKEEPKSVHDKEDEKINSVSVSNFEIKKEFKPETTNENDEVKESKSENESDQLKLNEDQHRAEVEEPKPKRIKLEHPQAEQEHLICAKGEIAKEELQPSAEEMCAKLDISTLKEEHQQLEDVVLSVSKDNEKVLKTESIRIDKQDSPIDESAELASTSTSTFLAVKTFAANLTFADVESITPPPPHTTTAAPIQRNKSLSDDDIQARLHSFHKENILFLQSRNKKTKSSSSLPSNSSNKFLANNNDHNKSRASSSSVSHHQHHHNHHHYHEGKEKSDKSMFKHYNKSSASTPDGSTKKQKVRKRERTTSSSSSNSHKNPQVSSSSSSNKNSVSSSSKKSKSLKKSSSGSSNSSNTSLTTSTLAPQSSYASTSTTATTAVLNCEKKKDKHHKQKITSTSSSNIHNTHATTFPSSKKRQLNFELELTKDMHLLNSVNTSGSKHKRETPRLLSDELSHSSVKKSRKDCNVTQKDELRNGSNKSVKPACSNSSANSQPAVTTAINTPPLNTLPIYTSLEEPKLTPAIAPQVPPTTTISKEHLRLPHFNNVISTNCSSASNQQSSQSPLIPVQSQPPPPIQPQNIPNPVNSTSLISSAHSNNLLQMQQPPLAPTPPPPGTASSPLANQNVNSTSHLPFYNTIYGKLLDNSAQPSTSLALCSNITSSPPVAAISVPTGAGVLSEYLDTKLKSYSTLGGYVSHSALFGLNKTTVNKDPNTSSAVVSSSTISLGATILNTKDSSSEMPAPLPSSSSSSALSSGSASNPAAVLPMKIHTKTASHDPRLNPQLTAPEPPPQPKRKLSINEYRKRMQQSSNDINCGSLTSTPTTPPSSLEPSSLLGPITMSVTNKCTLYSPDRLTQSVDSQIQKEIMSTNSVVSSSSSSDSLNSSNSSTSLNDSLLKSSSFVEEDSTKGQFNAAPTLLEKQQESLCARLKSLKEKQSLGTSFIVGGGNRSRFSSFSESVVSSEFGLRKDDDDMDIIRNRNISISSSIGGGDLLDNCLEEISSTSTSMSSSREPSPERSYSSHHSSLTASATTITTNSSATSHNNNGPTSTRHHQQDNINCDKNELTSLERKRSVDIA